MATQSIALFNATPLSLSVTLFTEPANPSSEQKFTLKSLATKKINSSRFTRCVAHPVTCPEVKFECELDHSRLAGELVFSSGLFMQSGNRRKAKKVNMKIVNASREHAEVSWIDSKGQKSDVHSGILAPGESRGPQTYEGHLWVAKSVFSEELMGMYFADSSSSTTLEISGDFKTGVGKEANQVRLIPSPVPEIPRVSLVGETREACSEYSRDYIFISERDLLPVKQFNTRLNVVTRAVRISGTTLRWDKRKSDNGLMDYQGESITDLQSLELFADRVIIASRLRFPGTRVSIHARELVFQSQGQIDTTPIDFRTRAESPFKTEEGYPADECGNITYRAMDGLDGEPGGDIELHVKQITVPQNNRLKRLLSNGSKGQDAEPGGHRKPSEKAKTRPAVTLEQIADVFWDSFAISRNLDQWRWPNGVKEQEASSPDDFKNTAKPEARMIASKKSKDKGSVVQLGIIAFDDTMGGTDMNYFWFPPGERLNKVRWSATSNFNFESYTSRISELESDGKWAAPGNGEDAYPGGLPGCGGNGGSVRATLPTKTLIPLVEMKPGQPGAGTAALKGKPGGGPNPAFRVDMLIVRWTSTQSWRKPMYRITEITAKKGKDAKKRENVKGRSGSIGVLPDNVGIGWLDPLVLDSVITFAGDSFRNGHRDIAARFLEPYYGDLRKVEKDTHAIPIELKNQYMVLCELRNRILKNLDYYGNPPGWLPRLTLETNYQIFKQVSSTTRNLLYYASALEAKFDSMEQADELSRGLSEALQKELDDTGLMLRIAYTDLATARDSLESVAEEVRERQQDLDMLRDWANARAQDRMQRQMIYRGIMKSIGGVMKIIPYGQPYLGFGGDLVSNIGDFDFTDPDGIPDQVKSLTGKVGDLTDSFLEENRDLIIEDLTKDKRQDLGKITVGKSAIQEDLDSATSAMSESEAKVESHKEKMAKEVFDNSDYQKKQKAFQDRIKDIDEELDGTKSREIKESIKTMTTQISEHGPENYLRLKRQQKELNALLKKVNDEEAEAARKHDKKQQQTLAKLNQALDGQVKNVASHQERIDTASKQEAALARELENKKESYGNALDRLQNLGSGIATLGEGIGTLMQPVTADDEAVQALGAKILASEMGPEQKKLLTDLQLISEKKSAAMTTFVTAQYNISQMVGQIAGIMNEASELSTQRQQVGEVLDVRVKRYLKDIQERTRDRLRWANYNFVMSFRYEFLRDVESDFYNMDKLEEKLSKLEQVDADTLLVEQGNSVDDNDGTMVWKSEFFRLATDILDERQKYATAGENHYDCELSPEQCEQLHANGILGFNLVRDLHKGNWKLKNARVIKIELTEFLAKLSKDSAITAPTAQITFTHSRESILRSQDDNYYLFRAAAGDDPIFWNFNFNHNVERSVGTRYRLSQIRLMQELRDAMDSDDDKVENLKEKLAEVTANLDDYDPSLGISPLSSSKKTDEMLNEWLGGETAVSYRDYNPSLFSDITLTLGYGSEADGENVSASSVLEGIYAVKFRVTYSSAG